LEPGYPAGTIPTSEKLQTDDRGKGILGTKTQPASGGTFSGRKSSGTTSSEGLARDTRRGVMELARAVVVSGTTIAVAR
jgi:hypothetical protein